MKSARIFLGIFLVTAVIINVFSVIYQHRQLYVSHDYWQRFPALRQEYLDSQYVNKHPKHWLDDQIVFDYAGGALIQGTSPVLIIPDAPPLGKYLIGLSAVLFDNEYIIVAIFGIASLFVLYLLSAQIFHDKLIALLPSFFFSFEPMFKNQFIYSPLLDLFQLFFILSYFYIINTAFTAKKRIAILFLLANMFLGFFVSTKFFVSGAPIVVASVIYFIFHRDRERFIKYILTLPIALFILLLSYARVFAFGYTLNHFLGIQKWVFLYHKSQLILPFSVWPLLLFNQWHVWFGAKPVISDSQWFITWPLITILSFITIIFYIMKKIRHTKEIELLMIWAVCYLAFLSFGEIFSRYFIILIPIFYIIALYGLRSLLQQKYIKSLFERF